MARLAEETCELASLVIGEDGESIILHQEEGDRPLELGTYSGMVIPLHTTEQGKLFSPLYRRKKWTTVSVAALIR